MKYKKMFEQIKRNILISYGNRCDSFEAKTQWLKLGKAKCFFAKMKETFQSLKKKPTWFILFL